MINLCILIMLFCEYSNAMLALNSTLSSSYSLSSAIILVKGKVNDKDGQSKVLADKAKLLTKEEVAKLTKTKEA